MEASVLYFLEPGYDKDNDADVNQFEEMPLFTNPMNIKHIEKNFDKNLLLHMRKCGKGKFV
jgi:hypothetical protein